MKCLRIILPLLLLTWSCATRQPVKSLPENEKVEFRAFFLPSDCWRHSVPDSIRIWFSNLMNAAGKAGYHAMVLDMTDLNEARNNESPDQGRDESSDLAGEAGRFDPLNTAVEVAHRNGLQIFAYLDPLDPALFEDRIQSIFLPNLDRENLSNPQDSWHLERGAGKYLDPAHPEVRTWLKNKIRDFVMEYDLDGLILDFGDISGLPEAFMEAPGSSPLAGFVGNLTAEAMLVKPYLVCGASFQSDAMNHYPELKEWVNNGMTDLLIPLLKDTKDPTHVEIYSKWLEGTMDHPGDGCENTLNKWTAGNPGHSGNAGLPVRPDITHPRLAFSLNLSPLLKAPLGGKSIMIMPDGKTEITDSEGRISFILQDKPDTLKILVEDSTLNLLTRFWKTPFEYEISESGSVTRKMPWLEFREMPDPVTHDPEFHLLCKTSWPATAWINDDTVKVYKTGIFFDKISLKEGVNRIRAGVATGEGESINYTREFIYVKADQERSPFPLWIEERSISPSMRMVLKPDDRVHMSFRGSKGQEARILVRPGKKEILCSRTDYDDYSLYEADILLKDWKKRIPHTLTLRLSAAESSARTRDLELRTETKISVMDASGFPGIRVIRDHTRLTYNLGPVRLGGPIRSELPEGIVMQTSGIFGDEYRIFLNEEEEGFVDMDDVEKLTGPSSASPYYITSLSCGPSDGGDILSIPYYNPIPYAVFPEPGGKMIRIRLYGAMTSSTWITHLQGRKIIEQVTWSQITPETYEVQVHLRTSRIWGYDLHPDGKRLIFFIKYPPEYTLALDRPLKGLKIAIEAGHGGESYGAMGLSGLFEKDINLDLAHRFGKLCKSHGAEIVQVRDSDTTMLLLDKRKRAIESGADLLISIHANAAGTGGGYLGVGGTSTYYHNPFWTDLAERMYNHLLELDLSEFGVVGSFNYTVIRVSQMPSILVEQAFMTHAEDEEKLASPEFRQAMAEKMYEGVMDFLTNMKKE